MLVYQDSFHGEKRFTEEDFVSLLLPLISEQGVRTVTEKELSKKLYPYKKRYEYKNIFQDVTSNVGQSVNIYDGIYREQFDKGNIFRRDFSLQMHLLYTDPVDFSCYLDKLSEKEFALFQKMVLEIVRAMLIEKMFHHQVEIYAFNPNKKYILYRGKYQEHPVAFSLLSDGKVVDKSYGNHSNMFVDSPYSSNEKVLLEDETMLHVQLKNARYAIMQGSSDKTLTRMVVYTRYMEEPTLENLCLKAQEEYRSDELVRHLYLK